MRKEFFFIAFLFIFLQGVAQQKVQDVYVDKHGVLRWGGTKEEVQGFGVNYTVPFAHAYKTAMRMGINIEKAIDDDVYHFARLGFDAYRVHVWDTEISDTLGNLLSNENLRLFDYMVKQMKDRGMKFILTPIAYWGNGWPEPDGKSPGFSRKYGKEPCLTNPDAIKAQENYLYQFLNHVNPYTKLAYKADPDMIAFEVSNEPHHNEAPEKVTEFINRMVKSMRATGCKKPIFYNVSHSIHLADAYFNAAIQGGTFQWYPSGLGARHELGGNFLPNVDRYTIPFANHPKFKSMAKIVYEFDAADIGRSYIYPAMARTFREAGMQVATHFAYDPTYMAQNNTEYGTHYMNLAYAPQKALSLMLASEVFHKIPMNKSFGRYPQNSTFDAFKVSYEEDLAEMITGRQFIYTNSTKSVPPEPNKLEQVAGSGNSTIVTYEGTGAYFLDRLEEGVWRLEVMPDAIWIDDPFSRTSPKKEVAVINWRTWPMGINLPDLGDSFEIKGINEGNTLRTKAEQAKFSIRPGTYMLSKEQVMSLPEPSGKWKNITLSEYVAPPTSVKKAYVIHQPAYELSWGSNYTVTATVVSATELAAVELHVWGGFRPIVLKMSRQHGYNYSASIAKENVEPGMLRYYITVNEGDVTTTFPGSIQTDPRDWDFYSKDAYTVAVVKNDSPLYLFNAATDNDQVRRQWVRGSGLVPTGEPGKAELQITIEKLLLNNSETFYNHKIYNYSLGYSFGKKIEGRREDLSTYKEIIFRGRSLNDTPCKLQVALILKDGSAYGGILDLTHEGKDYKISFTELRKIKPVTLPRPYPTFLPYYFDSSSDRDFDVKEIETVQFSLGPGIAEGDLAKTHGIAIESVRLK